MPKNKFFQRRLANLPIAQKLGLLTLLFAINVCILLAAAYFGMDLLAATRAYVGGESLWSKAQKKAQFHLFRYAAYGQAGDYRQFLAYLQVPLGDRMARLELDQPHPDLSVVYQGFVQGKNDPEDVRGMIFLYRYGGHFGPMKKAIEVWREGDRHIGRLLNVGERIHARVLNHEIGTQKLGALLVEAEWIDTAITPLEHLFSSTLGDGARWLKRVLTVWLLVITILFLGLSLAIAFAVSRSIAGRIARLRSATVRMGAGKFDDSMESIEADEMGDLLRTFQWMSSERHRAEEMNRRLARELASRLEALDQANHELESFSYSVSHDLRAPLRAITGFSNILAEDHQTTWTEDAKKLLTSVRRNAVLMGELLEGLLTFSRLSQRALLTVAVNVDDVVNGVIDDLRSVHGAIEVEKGWLGSIEGDEMLLRQVFFNLLANAVKFSRRAPSPLIRINRREEEGQAVFEVRDNGAGFEPEHKERLFGVFQRLHTTEEFEGTGVGLAIVQRIVIRHGGRVWAESEGPGQGAAFFVALPLKRAAENR